MKILKGLVLDKLKEKDSVGSSIWGPIGNSKWKNDILNDKDVMFLAAKKGISLSEIKNSKFINNERFLLLCTGHIASFDNLKYLFGIKSKFINDKRFIKKVTNTIDKFLTLKKYKSKFFKDKDIVYSLLRYRADAIIFADQKYIKDKKLVMKAMNLLKKQKKKIDSEFYGELELVLNNGSKKNHPLKKYYIDEKFVDMAIKLDGNIYSGLSDKQKLIKKYALAAVKHNNYNLEFVPFNHNNYREILIIAINSMGIIQYMDPKYNADEEILLTGIYKMSQSIGSMYNNEGSKFFWYYANKKLKKNKLFIIKALKLGFSSIITADDKFGTSDFNKDIIFDNDIKKVYWDKAVTQFKDLKFKSPIKELIHKSLNQLLKKN